MWGLSFTFTLDEAQTQYVPKPGRRLLLYGPQAVAGTKVAKLLLYGPKAVPQIRLGSFERPQVGQSCRFELSRWIKAGPQLSFIWHQSRFEIFELVEVGGGWAKG